MSLRSVGISCTCLWIPRLIEKPVKLLHKIAREGKVENR